MNADLDRGWLLRAAPMALGLLTCLAPVASAAETEPHWAFVPPQAPPLPAVKAADWPRHPLDRFVLARLEAEGLRPAREADCAALLRRVSLALTGLPPSPAELDAFLADPAPDAFERVVERLLRSPRYGEHMARYWLDAARYADTHGYFTDRERTMWRWRDWVIDAFNRNLPFDQFTIEQLAGDLLPSPSHDQLVATGFNRNNMVNVETGIIPEEYRVEYVVDRVATTSSVWLGLTLACAQCHDHKHDPLSQVDYYRFFAYFNQLPEEGMHRGDDNPKPALAAPLPGQAAELTRVRAALAPLEKALTEPDAALDAQRAAWEGELMARVREAAFKASTAERWELAGPFPPRKGAPVFETAFAPEPGSTDAAPPAWEAKPDYTDNKQVTIPASPGALYLRRTVTSPSARVLKLRYSSDNPSKLWANGALVAALGDAVSGQAAAHDLELTLRAGANEILLKLVDYDGNYSFQWRPQDEVVDGFPLSLVAALTTAPDRRTPAQTLALRRFHRAQHVPSLRSAAGELAELRRQESALENAIPTTMIMRDLAEPRENVVLVRGQYQAHGQKVTPGLPAALLAGGRREAGDRLDLARWLVSPENPLTARVTVNRLWQQFFGTGLVKSVGDFGTLGERPSHPELLDWLAVEFVRSGWDVQALQRMIVTSATFRQWPGVTPELLERDPENRLLARGPRLRMDAEMVRDHALAVSGLLAEQLGGPSVKPYQPAHVWKDVTYDKKNEQHYIQDRGTGLYRRSLYTFWKRQVPPPTLAVFDAPTREVCTLRRQRTNTPLQALALMNDPQFVEAARVLAARVLREGGTDDGRRVVFAFRLATSRTPQPAETQTLEQLLRRQREVFRGDTPAAHALLGVGEARVEASLDPVELAAWTTVTSVLLNLDETITLE
jgi:hypothetical protein